MQKKNDRRSLEKTIIQYLKKNTNILFDNPELINILNFPTDIRKSKKIIDLNAYRTKKLNSDNIKLKKQISAVLKAGSSHIASQKKILKTSLKILNTKSLSKLIDVIINELGELLGCDLVNCFFTSNKIKHKNINQIDNKLATNYFKDKPQTNLNQNPNGIPIFFPNKTRIIKSYILLKIIYGSDRFIVAMGSQNEKKFTKDQRVDLIEYLIQIIQIKLLDLS